MHGLGTIVNVAAIVVGGLAGLLGGRRIPERLQKTLMSAMGVSVLFVGVSGALSQMLRAEGGALTVQGTMMMILSLAVGAVAGELLDLEDRMERFGAWLKVKTKSESDGGFIGAFVTASLTVCIGAMAIVGSIQDGILGDHATLFAKAVLDLVIIMVMTASMGKGCIFSAIPVGILQGSVTLLARLLQPVFTDAALSNLSLVGSVLVFCVGLNLVWGKKIRVANLLPSLIVSVVWAYAIWSVKKWSPGAARAASSGISPPTASSAQPSSARKTCSTLPSATLPSRRRPASGRRSSTCCRPSRPSSCTPIRPRRALRPSARRWRRISRRRSASATARRTCI